MQEKIMVIEDDEEMNQGICYMLKKEDGKRSVFES